MLSDKRCTPQCLDMCVQTKQKGKRMQQISLDDDTGLDQAPWRSQHAAAGAGVDGQVCVVIQRYSESLR